MQDLTLIFRAGVNRRALRINFTLNDESRLIEGARRLARAFEAMRDAKN